MPIEVVQAYHRKQVTNKEKGEMNRQEDEWSHLGTQLVQQISVIADSHVIVVHVIVVSLLDSLSCKDEVHHEVDRDPKKIEAYWDVEELRLVKLKVDGEETPLFLWKGGFVGHGVPSQVPQSYLREDMESQRAQVVHLVEDHLVSECCHSYCQTPVSVEKAGFK